MLNNTLPTGVTMYVTISSPDTEANFDFKKWIPGSLLDTSLCTLLVDDTQTTNLGWGDQRPESAKRLGREYARRATFQVGPRTPYVLELSPSEDMVAFFRTDVPRNTAVGAVFVVVGVAGAFVLFDHIASGYLREVIVSSVQQHSAKTESMWCEAQGASTRPRATPRRVHEPAAFVNSRNTVALSAHLRRFFASAGR